MHTGFPANLVYALALLGIGLGTGWWLRGEFEAPASPAPVMEVVTAPAPPAPVLADTTVAPPGLDDEPEPRGYSDALTDHSPEAEPPPEIDLTQEFRALLASQSYFAAMDVYRQVERQDRRAAAGMKRLVLEHLESYLQSRDDDALTSLADAFLSVYFDDIDVLMILARYQSTSDYFAEAARTFQLAFAYSQTRAGEQPLVKQEFRRFVENVDQRLAARGQWRDLTRFYETLQQLDLTRPEYQLRLGQLYLDHGERRLGYELLHRLSENPAVASQARALLDASGSDTTTPEPRRPATDSVSLEMLGNHYHLPLTLNSTLDVQLMIDTGASVTTLSRQAFEAIRYSTEFTELGPQLFNTAGGTSRGTVYRVHRVQLGSHTLSDVNIAVLDFNMPGGVDGLLGMNVLRHFRFQVDQDNHQLHLQPRI